MSHPTLEQVIQTFRENHVEGAFLHGIPAGVEELIRLAHSCGKRDGKKEIILAIDHATRYKEDEVAADIRKALLKYTTDSDKEANIS